MKSINTSAVARLNAINSGALRALHEQIGFDFEKPFACIALDGNFTMKKIQKEIAAAGYTSSDTVALLTHTPHQLHRRGLYLVRVDGEKIDIDFRCIKHNVCNFYTKGDFESVRKNPNAETFIIVQHPEYINKIDAEKPVDKSARYTKAPSAGRYNGYYTLDKSGYILNGRFEELKRRANALRRDRAKAAYLLTDNSAKVENLRGLIAAKKEQIISELVAAETHEQISAVGKKLDWWRGLGGIVENFERYEAKSANHDYSSIEESERAYNDILEKLSAC